MQGGDNFLVAVAGGHKLEDGQFARRQIFLLPADGEFFLQAIAELGLADGNMAEGLDDLCNLGTLAHIAKDSSLGRPPNAFRVFKDGKQDDAGIGEFRANFGNDFVAIPIR